MKFEQDKATPLVSIALAIYNGEEYMREQIDSLLGQTYKNIEVVISDDSSTDSTQSILKEYVRRDSRVRWSVSANPRGCKNNFESAISLCEGEIVFLCDGDDVWDFEKVSLHMKEYEDPSVGWVYNRSVLTDKNKNEIGFLEDSAPEYYTHKRTMLENAWGSCLGGAHASFRSSLIRKAIPIDANAGSHDAWIQLIIWPAKSVFIDKVLQIYRQHGTNDSGWNPGVEEIMSHEEFLARENLAISNNRKLIKSIVLNRNVVAWKRIFFGFVYVAKLARDIIKK